MTENDRTKWTEVDAEHAEIWLTTETVESASYDPEHGTLMITRERFGDALRITALATADKQHVSLLFETGDPLSAPPEPKGGRADA
jgi:hypothetical protein